MNEAVPSEFETFRRQESTLVFFGLAAVALLLVVHVAGQAVLGEPPKALLVSLAALFLALTVELLWLRALRVPLSDRAVRVFSVVWVWVVLGLVFTVTLVGDVEDRHYAALMILPVISAAFRLSLPSTLGVAAIAGALNVAAVRYYYVHHPPPKVGEHFEAFIVSLIFFIVGAVVWLLNDHLRRDRARLVLSLGELRRARDRLVAEERLAAVGRFAGAIAHEIRNPVTMISSSLAAVREGRLPAAECEQMFGIAVAEARRLETFTSDFLVYAGTRPPERRPTAVATVLGYVVDLARGRAAEQRVGTAVRCPSVLEASLDPFQIQRLVLNLVANALDATPPGGLVTVGAGSTGGGCEIFVENDGAPVTEEALARIFEPFFTTKRGGTGLGLAIARSIAQAHGGDLSLACNEPGRVRFVATLPGRTESDVADLDRR